MLIPTPDIPRPARVVLDTNTVMALWHFRDPRLCRLSAALDSGRLSPVLRADTAEELRRVLGYVQFGIAAEAQDMFLATYRRRCEEIPVLPQPEGLPRCRDTDDQKFLELAIQAEVALLVSRDKALLKLARHRLVRDRLIILTPERLEPMLAAES